VPHVDTYRRLAPAFLVTLALGAGGVGCAHAPRASVLRPALAEDCEGAAAALALRPPHPAGDELRRALTTPASWLLTGTAYVVDVSFTAVGGVLVGTAVCMPLVLLEGSLHGNGEASAQCIVGVAEVVVSDGGVMKIGEGTAEATRSWRCLDRVGEAREVLAAAGCFTRRDWPGDRDVARFLLTGYREDRGRFGCTPARERKAVEGALEAVTPVVGAPADAEAEAGTDGAADEPAGEAAADATDALDPATAPAPRPGPLLPTDPTPAPEPSATPRADPPAEL
jgi:hypothetical protein